MKFRVGIEQNSIPRGEAKNADAAGRGKVRLKQCLSGDGVLVEIGRDTMPTLNVN